MDDFLLKISFLALKRIFTPKKDGIFMPFLSPVAGGFRAIQRGGVSPVARSGFPVPAPGTFPYW